MLRARRGREARMERRPGAALLGLGTMGSRMAQRLLAAGWPLAVFDVRAEAATAAVAGGARRGATPRETVQEADFVVLMVRDFPQAEQALLGAEGALAGAVPGTTLIVTCTLAPGQARLIEQRAAERGVEVLDAPVSGGTAGAESGTLSIMVGGSAERFERCRPLLEQLGQRIYHVGPGVGDGQSAKMVNQLLCGVHLVAA